MSPIYIGDMAFFLMFHFRIGDKMGDERLLERIQNLELKPGQRTDRDFSRKINSIINHLKRLLNTRQGSVPVADDYGIPDITNSHGEGITEMTDRIERMLRDTVMKYEPRLDNVHVKLLSQKDDVLSLRFKLEAVLVSENNVPVVLETIVSSDGKVNISS